VPVCVSANGECIIIPLVVSKEVLDFCLKVLGMDI